tara:strand:- start:1737 stop:1913 length:177 start_codon:yes stop_codon:yes gene_type:complete
MLKIFKPTTRLFALFLFLPITPSIAAIAVFTQSLLIDRNTEVSIVTQNAKSGVNAVSY